MIMSLKKVTACPTCPLGTGHTLRITIVIITPFGRYGAEQHLQNERILYNFEEAFAASLWFSQSFL
jgi:hypothetical protein